MHKFKLSKKVAAAAAAAALAISLIGCSAAPPAQGAPDTTASADATQSAEASAKPNSGHGNASHEPQSTATSSTVSADVPTETDFSKKDLTDTWAPGTPEIRLEGTSISADSANVQVAGTTATVTGAGAYRLTGSLTDGQIIVEAGDKDDVQLVLDGADITCSDGPAIHVKSADKVILTLAPGKDNSVTDGATYADTSDSAPNAAIYAEEDLSINGTGSLTVTANNNNGIATRDDLAIADGTLTVSAPNHALKGKDSVSIGSGTFVLEAGGDGIQSDQDSDATKGWIVIDDGEFTITAGNDGIQAQTGLTIHGGTFNITTNGGAANAEQKTNQGGFGGFRFPDSTGDGSEFGGFGQRPDGSEFGGFGQRPDGSGFGGFGQRPDGTGFGGHGGRHDGQAADTASADTTNGTLPTSVQPLIAAAEESADQTDDSREPAESAATAENEEGQRNRPSRPDAETSATEMRPESSGDQTRPGSTASASSASSDSSKGLKSDGNILVTGGVFDFNCADDGVHANGSISLDGGKFRIASGGDAVHADGDLSTRADIEITESYEGLEGLNIQIEDGTISLKSSDDGINAAGDSGRASLTISGGVVRAECGGDGVDSNGDVTVTGGDVQVLIRSSADNGAIDADGSFTATGGTLIYGGTGTGAGPQSGSSQSYVYASGSFTADQVVSLRQNGQEIMSFTPSIDCSSLIFSQPGIESGATYEVYAADTLVATATAGQGGSGMMGGFGQNGGTMPGTDGTRPGRPGTSTADTTESQPTENGTRPVRPSAGNSADAAESSARPTLPNGDDTAQGDASTRPRRPGRGLTDSSTDSAQPAESAVQ